MSLFFVVAIAACLGSCGDDDDDPNLKIVYTIEVDLSVRMSIGSFLDVDIPVMSVESDYTPKTFTFFLNAEDYRFRATDFVLVNFQIRGGKNYNYLWCAIGKYSESDIQIITASRNIVSARCILRTTYSRL